MAIFNLFKRKGPGAAPSSPIIVDPIQSIWDKLAMNVINTAVTGASDMLVKTLTRATSCIVIDGKLNIGVIDGTIIEADFKKLSTLGLANIGFRKHQSNVVSLVSDLLTPDNCVTEAKSLIVRDFDDDAPEYSTPIAIANLNTIYFPGFIQSQGTLMSVIVMLNLMHIRNKIIEKKIWDKKVPLLEPISSAIPAVTIADPLLLRTLNVSHRIYAPFIPQI